MRRYTLALVTAALALMCALQPAWSGDAETSAALHAEGRRLLSQGEFVEATRAFFKAFEADESTTENAELVTVLRRVISLRAELDRKRDDQVWERSARSLRAFYYDHLIAQEALALDEQFHERFGTVESATMLAESRMEMGLNEEAESLLASIDAGKISIYGRFLHGIVLARLGRFERAEQIVQRTPLPSEADTGLLFQSARLRALLNDRAGALTQLARAFEQLPPSRQPIDRRRALACPDFGSLHGDADFSAALHTKSMVKESSCTGGSSCGGCRHAASCSRATGG